jgi:hypothetical protein
VQPAVNDDLGGVLGPAEVAAHDVGAAHDDLTVEAGGEFGSVGVEDPDLLAWEGDADGACSPGTGDRVEGGGAGALGEAVALDEREAVPVFEPVSSSADAGAAPQTPNRREDVSGCTRSGRAASML